MLKNAKCLNLAVYGRRFRNLFQIVKYHKFGKLEMNYFHLQRGQSQCTQMVQVPEIEILLLQIIIIRLIALFLIGIHFEHVRIVVNFDLPVDVYNKEDCNTYLRRIGIICSGIVINLVDSEYGMQICKNIEKYFSKKIELLNTENCDEIEKIGS